AASSSFSSILAMPRPRMAWAYQGRGIARMDLNELESAIVDFSHAIELDSDFVNAYMNRGLALLLKGNDEEAKKDFARVITLKPGIKDELATRVELVEELRSTKH